MADSIVLVESHYRSRSWFLALKNIGLTHVISVMPEEFKLFKRSGIHENNILNLYYNDQVNKKYEKDINYFEHFLGIKLNSIVFMDRTLRKKKEIFIKKYLTFLLNEIEIFFNKVKPKVIFIEPTWTHEILICKFAKKYNVAIVAPVKDKLLPDRFLAFKDENHINFHKNCYSQNAYNLSVDAYNMVVENKPVQYFEKFNNRNKFDLRKVPKLYRLIKISILNFRNPNIQNSLINDISIKLISIVRSKLQRFFLDFQKLSKINRKFILITLHVQPEASIDVVGSKYSNQIEFVRNIAMTTPVDYILLIKEHSHAIGNRSYEFYKNLLEIPNVVLLDPFENSREAIKKASLVISNTGTSSLEAGILGVPAVTATSMFYKKLMLKTSFDPIQDNVENLLTLNKQTDKNKLVNNLQEIYNGSFKGNCGDFQTDKNVLKKENIKDLETSFDTIIKSIN